MKNNLNILPGNYMKAISLILFTILVSASFIKKIVKLDGINWRLNKKSNSETYKGEECLNIKKGIATTPVIKAGNLFLTGLYWCDRDNELSLLRS